MLIRHRQNFLIKCLLRHHEETSLILSANIHYITEVVKTACAATRLFVYEYQNHKEDRKFNFIGQKSIKMHIQFKKIFNYYFEIESIAFTVKYSTL